MAHARPVPVSPGPLDSYFSSSSKRLKTADLENDYKTRLGRTFAEHPHTLVSGGAVGADLAWTGMRPLFFPALFLSDSCGMARLLARFFLFPRGCRSGGSSCMRNEFRWSCAQDDGWRGYRVVRC